ncbi:tyrosine/serine/threonine protein phosphatase pps1 [Balamuthia mandrillaris]
MQKRGRRNKASNEDRLRPKPSEILPWLYLGTKYHFLDSVMLRELGITRVLSVVGGRIPEEYPPEKYAISPMSDYGTDKLATKLPPLLEFIGNCLFFFFFFFFFFFSLRLVYESTSAHTRLFLHYQRKQSKPTKRYWCIANWAQIVAQR